MVNYSKDFDKIKRNTQEELVDLALTSNECFLVWKGVSMRLPEVINVDKSKCQHCLACIQVCPVKLCNIVEPDGISVQSDLCIGCGECIRVCHEKGHKARYGGRL